jgi:L-galactono-1,4-lactone dehydrogenase
VISNWSGTHEAKTSVYVQPESLEDLEKAVSLAHSMKQKLRPVGSGLSPNGVGFSDDGMINLALMDKIVNIDTETKRVTVQAGARVEQVVEALRPYGLTLQNFASIRQQQIGGFTQVIHSSPMPFASFIREIKQREGSWNLSMRCVKIGNNFTC